MHLPCNELCISFLNDIICHSISTAKVDFTMASFAHRVHHEERGVTFRLDAEWIERIKQLKSDQEPKVLNDLFKTSNPFKAEAIEEVSYYTPRQSYSLQYLAIDQRNDSFRGNFRRELVDSINFDLAEWRSHIEVHPSIRPRSLVTGSQALQRSSQIRSSLPSKKVH